MGISSLDRRSPVTANRGDVSRLNSVAFRKDDTLLSRHPGGLMEQRNGSIHRGSPGDGRRLIRSAPSAEHDPDFHGAGHPRDHPYKWRKAWRLQGGGLNATERSAYCRERGLYPGELSRWRQAAKEANAKLVLTKGEQKELEKLRAKEKREIKAILTQPSPERQPKSDTVPQSHNP